jgi:predicted TIM-barrel fold metal-dependent hydrolase
VWASDYPHPDSHFPGAVRQTLATLAPYPAETQAGILAGNAARLYGLDVPAVRRTRGTEARA